MSIEIRESEALIIAVRRDNGQVAHLETHGEELIEILGYQTKCNKCGRIGSPLTLGEKCASCGSCDGTMGENK